MKIKNYIKIYMHIIYIYINFDELTIIFENFSNLNDIINKLNPIIKNNYIQSKPTHNSLNFFLILKI